MLDADKPEISRGLAKLFNQYGLFDLRERRKMIEKYDSLSSVEKALKNRD